MAGNAPKVKGKAAKGKSASRGSLDGPACKISNRAEPSEAAREPVPWKDVWPYGVQLIALLAAFAFGTYNIVFCGIR